jgi:hypothetical protein
VEGRGSAEVGLLAWSYDPVSLRTSSEANLIGAGLSNRASMLLRAARRLVALMLEGLMKAPVTAHWAASERERHSSSRYRHRG